MSLQAMILNEWTDVPKRARCPECNSGTFESRFWPGHFSIAHRGDCPFNDATYPCDRCGFRHIDRDFGQVLACIMDVSLEEGRDMQRRIVERLQG